MARKRVNPRQARRMMEKMGMKMDAVADAKEVIIRRENIELVIENPQVTFMQFQGQKIYQVMGSSSFERPITGIEEIELEKPIQVSEEDIQLVAAQAGVSYEVAKQALEQTKGDLAQAILNLSLMK
jgi:nascent polypeptide-associated complex subunit alpha